jgi:hypothetical protein
VLGKLRRLANAQSWRDLLHVLVSFVLSTITFSIAVTWAVGGPGGVTYWFWSQWLPENDTGLPALLGYPGRFFDVTFNTVLGLLLVATTPIVLRGLIGLHAAVGRALLVDERSALRAQVSQLTESRTAAGDAEVHTLRRLERDLHDGPQQRLVRWAWTSLPPSAGWTTTRRGPGPCSTRHGSSRRTPWPRSAPCPEASPRRS